MKEIVNNTYRYEFKYLCASYIVAQIMAKLQYLLDFDTHHENGQYIVHSLYFDNTVNRCANDVESSEGKRFKYRIRYYNDNTNYILLEYKEKVLGKVKKTTCQLTKQDLENILNGEVWHVFYSTENKLLKHFCLNIICKNYKPKIITEYDRTAFVDSNINLRVTIDKNIVISTEVDKFLSGDYYRYPIQKDSMSVLEVKCIDVLPSYIRNVLNLKFLRYTSFSKYFKGYKTKLKGEKIWNF